MKVDQKIVQKYYEISLCNLCGTYSIFTFAETRTLEAYPRITYEYRRSKLVDDVKKVYIRNAKKIKIVVVLMTK